MKKRLSTLFLIFVLGTAAFAANLRDYVCVVKGNFSEERTELLNKMATNLETSGYSAYSEIIKENLKGSFGSGFIFYAASGKPYILTNRHVVLDFQTATVSFENSDGSTSEYKDLKIVDISTDYDLALIELPEGFSRKGLTLYTKEIQDGDDVYSAGFPGLIGKPSWQLGKGIVSNSKAKIEELLDPSVSTIIQHTAELDGGNSGGPLLIADSKSESGYLVAGINTWKAYSRENTNFAIPASLIKKYINEFNNSKPVESIETVNAEFIKSASSNKLPFVLSKYVSDDMVRLYGEKALKRVLAIASTEIRTEVVYNFRKSPFDGMRKALAWCIIQKLYDKNFENFITPEEPVYSESPLGTKVVLKNTEAAMTLSFIWQNENKYWEIYKVEELFAENTAVKKRNDKIYFELDSVYALTLNAGWTKPFNGNTSNGNAQFLIDAKYVSFGFDLSLGNFEISDMTLFLDTFGAITRLQLPMLINDFGIMPFAGANLGFLWNWTSFNSSQPDTLSPFTWGIEAGVEVFWCSPADFGLGLGVKYKMTAFNINEDEYAMFQKAIEHIYNNNITIYATVRFFEW